MEPQKQKSIILAILAVIVIIFLSIASIGLISLILLFREIPDLWDIILLRG